MSDVRVHTWEPNSNAGKPLFALNEKGVAFEHVYVSLTDFEQHAPEYLKLNPAGTVPTMVHGDLVLTESTPMCEYIDRTFPGPRLVPDDPLARYRMRDWCRRTDLAAAALSVIGWHNFMGPMVRQKPPEELERLIARIPTKERRIFWATAAKATFTEQQLADARAKVGAWAATMDRRLAESAYLAGPDYSLADLVAFANFYALTSTVPEYANRATTPHLLDWLGRIYARPATMATFALGRSLSRRAIDIKAGLEQAA
ncbi:MAG: glutathione S-transferase family protein [Janthinobacterium lividum]